MVDKQSGECMKYELSVFDRIILLNILPQNIDMMLYGEYHKFLSSLSFDKEEYEKYGINIDGNNQAHWKSSEEKNIDIFSPIDETIKNVLEKCKEKGLIQKEHDSLYNKFIEEKL